MKNILTKTIAIGLTSLTVGVLANADSPYKPQAPTDSYAIKHANYSAMAYGLKSNNHGSTYGFYVRGYGDSESAAEANALDKCTTIGYGCRIVE